MRIGTIERYLATQYAKILITCYCESLKVRGSGPGVWYALDTAFDDVTDRDDVEKAAYYLERHNLLQRHPDNRQLVQVLGHDR